MCFSERFLNVVKQHNVTGILSTDTGSWVEILTEKN